MTLVVQKYGGSSVEDAESIKRVAKRVVDTRRQGKQVLVVVSAMGDTTDDLLDLAYEVAPNPSPRELDMLLSVGERISMALLAMTIRSMGEGARSFTGSQAGMITDTHHGEARIIDIRPHRIKETLEGGEIAIVAGFQGFSPDSRDITTLGRGGSDTTAVALAVAVCADECEIYTDVDGIFSADPRIVPRARPLQRVSASHMLELAAAGAKVLHLRAVEFARRHRMPLRVRSSFNSHPGTLIYPGRLCVPAEYAAEDSAEEVGDNREEDVEEPIITGIATETDQAKITVVGVPNRPGQAARILSLVSESNGAVDNILQNFSSKGDGLTDISFTLSRLQGARVIKALEDAQPTIQFDSLQFDDQIGKITLVGAGICGSAEVSAQFFSALAEAGINIEMISTSEVRVSVIIRADMVAEGAKAVHKSFGLDAAEEAVVHAGTGR